MKVLSSLLCPKKASCLLLHIPTELTLLICLQVHSKSGLKDVILKAGSENLFICCMCVYTQTMAHTWMSEENFWELLLIFHLGSVLRALAWALGCSVASISLSPSAACQLGCRSAGITHLAFYMGLGMRLRLSGLYGKDGLPAEPFSGSPNWIFKIKKNNVFFSVGKMV